MVLVMMPPDVNSSFAHNFDFTLGRINYIETMQLTVLHASMSTEVSGGRLWSPAVTCFWSSGVGLIIGLVLWGDCFSLYV